MKDINFKDLVKPYYEEALETLKKDVSINSIYDEKTISKDAPYGAGVKKCFDFLKELALKDGFNVDTCDGRALEISFGEGKNLIYVLAHQDVVPVSGNWKFGPFNPTIEDDKLYGRGTSDDKGPGISAYYALKALKDNGLINNFRVRLVFGGDEERGSSCLEYYFNTLKKEQPTYGFTPDGDFPLIYGEKGNYSNEESVAILHNVVGNFYKDNEVAMSFQSSKGTYNEITGVITLYENTLIVLKDKTSLSTDKLVWSGSNNDTIADGNVIIKKDDQMSAVADKCIIYAGYDKFKILGDTQTKIYSDKEK